MPYAGNTEMTRPRARRTRASLAERTCELERTSDMCEIGAGPISGGVRGDGTGSSPGVGVLRAAARFDASAWAWRAKHRAGPTRPAAGRGHGPNAQAF